MKYGEFQGREMWGVWQNPIPSKKKESYFQGFERELRFFFFKFIFLDFGI
jgi:hypothetical protein